MVDTGHTACIFEGLTHLTDCKACLLYLPVITLVQISQSVNTKVMIYAKMNPSPEKEQVERITLKKLIANAGTTQRDLSKKTGIKETTLNSWVAGRKTPRLDNAIVVAKELRVSLKTLSESLGLDTSDLPDDN